jgi:hypothetical protein
MPCTPKRSATRGASSTLTLTALRRPANSRAACSTPGATIRQGPHHGAHRSSSTGRLAAVTTWSKSSSPAAVSQGRAVWQAAQRATPVAAAGRRLRLPQLGQVTISAMLRPPPGSLGSYTTISWCPWRLPLWWRRRRHRRQGPGSAVDLLGGPSCSGLARRASGHTTVVAASGPEAMRAGGRRRTSRRVRGCRTWPAPGRRDPRVSVGDYPSVPPLSSTGRRRRRRRLQAIGWSHYLDGDGDASVPASGEVVRPHYFAPDGWRRPGKTPLRTALSPRLLISRGAALRRRPFPNENRGGCPLTPDLFGRRGR